MALPGNRSKSPHIKDEEVEMPIWSVHVFTQYMYASRYHTVPSNMHNYYALIKRCLKFKDTKIVSFGAGGFRTVSV